ncbi:MAG: ABC transporter permease [Clostridioides sp.]|jgi:D-methionine transport system permease protein|nr:ABC transporter permease [Clostridioides sp.]
MLFFSVLLGTIIGFFIAIILFITAKDSLKPNKFIYNIIDFIVNTIRSFPFIILMVASIPLTRSIVGTSLGEKAAIVPLTIAAAPFIARVIYNSMNEVDYSLIESGKAFGLSDLQIIFSVVLTESMPSIVSGLVLAIITILGATAMAGMVGAGGLGSVAMIYGYQNFNDTIMYGIVAILIVIVQVIQWAGNIIYKKMNA